jgi:excisionase family DNA binding protein
MPATALLTPKEVAELLHIHIRTVLKWCHSGELHACQLGGRRRTIKPRFRIAWDDVQKFLAGRGPQRSIRRKRSRAGRAPIAFYK